MPAYALEFLPAILAPVVLSLHALWRDIHVNGATNCAHACSPHQKGWGGGDIRLTLFGSDREKISKITGYTLLWQQEIAFLSLTGKKKSGNHRALVKRSPAMTSIPAIQATLRGAAVGLGGAVSPTPGTVARSVTTVVGGVPAGKSVRLNSTVSPAARVTCPASSSYPCFSSRISYLPGARPENTRGLLPEYFPFK